MKKHLILLALICVASMGFAQHNIIPAPVSYQQEVGAFMFQQEVRIKAVSSDATLKIYLDNFMQYLNEFGVSCKDSRKTKSVIQIILNKKANSKLGKEGYELDIAPAKISIQANQPAGVYNALQTIKQLLPATKEALPIKIKACKIIDYPRFEWRGLMLDVSRHFYSVEDVKAYLDKMAEYKFNVFHWHLSDDNGWRIEIKSLPKLTEVGAWRVERYGRFGGRPDPKPSEEATYGGFYTQVEIKDIVQYAADRNITIVPEIDMPGHSMAALAAYPELSTKQEPKFVNPGTKFAEWFGDGEFKMLIENTLNPADERTYDFADKVFTEIAALFPGEYIHMGGDECYHGYWEEDAKVLAFMKKNKIKNTHELQTYFVNRIEKIISSKGKKMIGWDEILSENLSKEAAVMSWRGMKGGIKATKLKHKVVMSPTTYAYLDYMQGEEILENHVYAKLSLQKSYEFNPIPTGVDAAYILGGQGNLWTEQIPSLPFAFYMTYPRAFALSESLWGTNSHNWDDFMNRTEMHFKRFGRAGLNICKAVYEPSIQVEMQGDSLICTLSNPITGVNIFYSIDGTYPPKFGNEYKKPIFIPEGKLKLRTQTYRDGQPLGREVIIDRAELLKRAKRAKH